MRGLGLLVVFAFGCSGSAAVQEPLQGNQGGSAGVAAASGGAQAGGGSAGFAGALQATGGASAGEAGSAGLAGGQMRAVAPAVAGSGGEARHAGSGGALAGAGGRAQGGLGGTAGEPQDGSAGAAQAGSGPAVCSGFAEYVVPVNTCLAVTGDYEQQTDAATCSASSIVSRDHCSTCASWTSTSKSSTILLKVGATATVKSYDSPGGVCPSNCKYIC